jgi:hypothetical protein
MPHDHFYHVEDKLELDILQHSTSVRIIDSCGQTSSRPLSSTRNHRIHSHNVGEEVLNPGITDYELGINLDFIRIEVERGRWIDVKLNDTTSEPMRIKTFEYTGNNTKVYISNPDISESITIKYVLAKFKK